MLTQFGDVILIHGNNPISYLIQLITKSYWSHSALALDPGWVAEMGAFGFNIRPLTFDHPFVVLRHRDLMNPYTPYARKVLSRMRNVIKRIEASPPQFDYLEMFRLGLKLIKKRLMAAITREEIGAFFCSALIDYVYEQSGIDLFPERQPDDTTPANLEELASGENPVFVLVYSNKN